MLPDKGDTMKSGAIMLASLAQCFFAGWRFKQNLSRREISQATWPSSPPASGPSRGPAPEYRFTISRETTYVTSPLRADGSVDYVKALNDELSRGVTEKNNAAIPIIVAIGPNGGIGEKNRVMKVLKELHLEDLPEEGDYLIDINEYTRKIPYSQPNSLKDRRGTGKNNWPPTEPINASEDPDLAAFLEINRKPLDAIVAATSLERFYIPVVRGDEPDDTMQQNVFLLRGAARVLAARAMMRAGEGDYEGACQDLLAVHRLARLIIQRPTMMDNLIVIAIETMSSYLESGIIAAGVWNQQQLADYLTQLQSLPELKFDLGVYDRDVRYWALDTMSFIARNGWDVWAKLYPESYPKLGHIDMDFDELLRLENEMIDGLVVILKEPSLPRRKAACEGFERSLFTYAETKTPASSPYDDYLDAFGLRKAFGLLQANPHADPKGKARIMFESWNGSPYRIVELVEGAAMYSRLVKVALALEIYKARHGRYPDKLDVLAPGIIKSIPQDAFIEQPLKYVLLGGGVGYRLYSVGANMKDEGARDRYADGDDIVINGGSAATQPVTTRPATRPAESATPAPAK